MTPFVYTGVRVRDLEKARRFYTEGLGLQFKERGRMAAGGEWMGLVDPETHLELELNYYPDQPPFREGDELDHLGFLITGIEDRVRQLESLGAKLRIPIFRDGNYRLAFLSDPDGIWIELQERVGTELPPTSQAVE